MTDTISEAPKPSSAPPPREDPARRPILIRGIIEFSNYCRGTCAYCGLRRPNRRLRRYRMEGQEILAAVDRIYRLGLRTAVLQSGEDPQLTPGFLQTVIESIKEQHPDMAVTLSVGEHPRPWYRLWRRSGADRYLLKMETFHPNLYRRLHPGMDFNRRLRCLDALRELGYQTGSGLISGLPGRSPAQTGRDLEILIQQEYDMVSIGPFIPHPDTPLAKEPAGTAAQCAGEIRRFRSASPLPPMPATSALAAGTRDLRPLALQAGADVLMPNLTPAAYRRLYSLYPSRERRGFAPQTGASAPPNPNPAPDLNPAAKLKTGLFDPAEEHAALAALRRISQQLGRTLDFSRGDCPTQGAPP